MCLPALAVQIPAAVRDRDERGQPGQRLHVVRAGRAVAERQHDAAEVLRAQAHRRRHVRRRTFLGPGERASRQARLELGAAQKPRQRPWPAAERVLMLVVGALDVRRHEAFVGALQQHPRRVPAGAVHGEPSERRVDLRQRLPGERPIDDRPCPLHHLHDTPPPP